MTECISSALQKSGRRRYGVILALFALSMITYIDRASISTAKDSIAAELRLSDGEMGSVFSAFALGYAVMQIPAGWLVDRIGPRITLTLTVGIWSALTALTGIAWSYHSLLATRFLFGAGEAAVFPGSTRAIVNWIRPEHRGRANGALFAGSRLGAALSYPLLAWMLTSWNWRAAFFLLGIAGIFWTVFWLTWFRDMPTKSLSGAREVSPLCEHAEVVSTLAGRPLGLLMLQYFASNFTNFICLSWMLPYLKTQYHLSITHAAAYSMAPLLLGATAQGAAGWLVDWTYLSRQRSWSRQLPAMIGFSLAAAGLIAVTQARSVNPAIIAFSVAIFGADMTISPSWVFCADAGGTRTGRVSGAMNTFGSIGALVSASAFPFLLRNTGSSSAYFAMAALLDLAGVACWLSMRSGFPPISQSPILQSEAR